MSLKEWLDRTDGGFTKIRSSKLKAVDEAIETYHRSPNQFAINKVKDTLTQWKDKEAAEKSIRNMKGAVDELYKQVIAPPLVPKLGNKIWCPAKKGFDDIAVELALSNAKAHLNVHHDVLYGGENAQALSNFSPNGTLYIVAHGLTSQPLFSVGNNQWNAEQIADLLMNDQLHKEQSLIELLVCNAGFSGTTKKAFTDLRDKIDKLKALEADHEKAEARDSPKQHELFDNVMKAQKIALEANKIDNRSSFGLSEAEKVHQQKYPLDRGDKPPADPLVVTALLPLAAQLAQALKSRGYRNFKLISYKSYVSTDYSNGIIKLDINNNKEATPASLRPDLRVIWQ